MTTTPPAFTHIAIKHVHLVTRAALMPRSRMILLATADGKEFSFARHVMGRVGLPALDDITEAGREYEPPLVMTISHSGYLMSVVEQPGIEDRSS